MQRAANPRAALQQATAAGPTRGRGGHVQSELPLKGVTPAPSPLPATSTLNTELRRPAVSCWRPEGLFLGYSLCTRGPLVEGTVTSVPGTGEQGLELTTCHEHAQTTAACRTTIDETRTRRHSTATDKGGAATSRGGRDTGSTIKSHIPGGQPTAHTLQRFPVRVSSEPQSGSPAWGSSLGKRSPRSIWL